MRSITLGILSYNRPQFLVEAIESALVQTVKPEKIIIFDNGSNHEVYESIAHFIERDVKWDHVEDNRSPKYIYEKAMNECETEFIMFLHDDDRLHSNFLEVQLAFFDKYKELVGISCNGNLIHFNGLPLNKTISKYQNNSLNIQIYKNSVQAAMKYASNSCIPFSPTIYRAKYVIESVLRDEEFKKCTDAVFLCDLADRGHLGYTTLPLYDCRIHPNQDSSSFPLDQLQKLEDYFFSLTCIDQNEKKLLDRHLIRRHTLRNTRRCLNLLRLWQFNKIPSLILDSKFKFLELFKEFILRVIKFKSQYQ